MKKSKFKVGKFEGLLSRVSDPYERTVLRGECLQDALSRMGPGERASLEKQAKLVSVQIPGLGRLGALALLAAIGRVQLELPI